MWVHRLSNKDMKNKTADCSNCGFVKIKRQREGQYRCWPAIYEYRKIHGHRIKYDRPNPQVCELCDSNTRVAYDHNHVTNKFRGWLCMKCNTALGLVGDSVELLEKMIHYLKREPN